ncbi:MAG: LLM class flavin-dependent oxidoreductase, partial [Halieaceae bacterium]|nr:LLM class flavin-dependent oxidoreductase [Halieaceae bacterium]
MRSARPAVFTATMPEALSLGLVPWQMGAQADAGHYAAQAEMAERWGYQSFFLPENHFAPATPLPDPLLVLAVAASATRTIRLGTTSWLLPIREPLLAAAQAASLDQLCGGRLILGLGRGYRADMLKAFGVASAEKRNRFEAVLASLREAWSGAPVLEDQPLVPLPLQRPHPPLWVAAFGPKAIAQAGRLGLPYFASPLESLAELERNFARHDLALAEHGQPRPETRVIMRTVFVSDDPALLAELREKLASQPAGPLDRAQQPAVEDICLLGTAAEVAAQLQDYQSALGLTHLVAVRPRVSGLSEEALQESFAQLATLSPGQSHAGGDRPHSAPAAAT